MKIFKKYSIAYICRIKTLVIIFTGLFSYSEAQETPPALRINLALFSECNVKKATYKYYVDYSRDSSKLSENFTNPEVAYNPLINSDTEEDYSRMQIRHFREGTILHLRIKQTRGPKIMDIFIRFCYPMSHRDQVTIEYLSFKKGIFFYDMCASGNKFLLPCPIAKDFSNRKYATINMQSKSNFKISFLKLLAMSNQQVCGNL